MAVLKHIFSLSLISLCLSAPALAQTSLSLQEQEIKAGLIYNFLKYTEWPSEGAVGRMTVCLYGNDAFNSYVQPMAGRTVSRQEIAVIVIKDINDAGQCHLLFVPSGEKNRWADWQKALAGKPVLTVSDMRGFSQQGGMIEFGRKDNRISVSLNINAVTVAGLRVQERLLKLMTVVHSGEVAQ